jgi:hypothetical protein
MHYDWFNGIEILQGRWQHGEKVGYCYPSGLEKTLCEWEIYVQLVTKRLSPMYFNCNTSVTGHRHEKVGVLQRQQLPRSTANSSLTISSDYPGSLKLAISRNLISKYINHHNEQQPPHNSPRCALASYTVVFRHFPPRFVSLLHFLKLTCRALCSIIQLP